MSRTCSLVAVLLAALLAAHAFGHRVAGHREVSQSGVIDVQGKLNECSEKDLAKCVEYSKKVPPPESDSKPTCKRTRLWRAIEADPIMLVICSIPVGDFTVTEKTDDEYELSMKNAISEVGSSDPDEEETPDHLLQKLNARLLNDPDCTSWVKEGDGSNSVFKRNLRLETYDSDQAKKFFQENPALKFHASMPYESGVARDVCTDSVPTTFDVQYPHEEDPTTTQKPLPTTEKPSTQPTTQKSATTEKPPLTSKKPPLTTEERPASSTKQNNGNHDDMPSAKVPEEDSVTTTVKQPLTTKKPPSTTDKPKATKSHSSFVSAPGLVTIGVLTMMGCL